MDFGWLWRTFVKVTLSLFGAGLCYFIWMGAFLLSAGLESAVVETLGWLLAPPATATGFAAGILLYERLTRTGRANFWRIFLWPLIGCTIGAGTVYWFGPMLIVFGMFLLGTVSVILREVIPLIKR